MYAAADALMAQQKYLMVHSLFTWNIVLITEQMFSLDLHVEFDNVY